MSYIMDTIFGDGSEGSGTPDALKTVGSFFNTGVTFGAGIALLGIGAEVGSNSVSGGVDMGGGASAAPAANMNMSVTGPSM